MVLRELPTPAATRNTSSSRTSRPSSRRCSSASTPTSTAHLPELRRRHATAQARRPALIDRMLKIDIAHAHPAGALAGPEGALRLRRLRAARATRTRLRAHGHGRQALPRDRGRTRWEPTQRLRECDARRRGRAGAVHRARHVQLLGTSPRTPSICRAFSTITSPASSPRTRSASSASARCRCRRRSSPSASSSAACASCGLAGVADRHARQRAGISTIAAHLPGVRGRAGARRRRLRASLGHAGTRAHGALLAALAGRHARGDRALDLLDDLRRRVRAAAAAARRCSRTAAARSPATHRAHRARLQVPARPGRRATTINPREYLGRFYVDSLVPRRRHCCAT